MSSSREDLVLKTRAILFWRGLGVLSGFLLDGMVLAWFGLGERTDALVAALCIPLAIDGALGVQLTQVMVPMVTAIRREEGITGANRFINNVITVWLLVVTLMVLVLMALTRMGIPLLLPGASVSLKTDAINMTLILLWLVPIFGVGAVLSGVLYSLDRYQLASSMKAVNNGFVIAVGFCCYHALGIYGLAVGYLAGAAGQCVALWWGLRRSGFHYRPLCDLGDVHLWESTKLVVYPLAGQLLGEVRMLLENYYASFYPAGSLSALRYAARIVHAVSGVLMSSVVTATTPAIAQQMADRNLAGMKSAVRQGVKLLVFMACPVCLWLLFDSDRLIRVAFERGKFLAADTALTSQLILLLSPYILFSRIISITQTPFYAIKNTRSLVVGMVWSFVLYVALIPLSLRWFGIYGFPIASSLAGIGGAWVMYALACRTFGAMGWGQLGHFCARIVGALAMSALGFLLGNLVLPKGLLEGFGAAMVEAAVPSTLGLTFFIFGALRFGLISEQEIAKQFTSNRFFSKRQIMKAAPVQDL